MNADVAIPLAMIGVILIWAGFTWFRNRRALPARCPACLRLGKLDYSGSHRCSNCGAVFALDAKGRPTRLTELIVPHWVMIMIAGGGLIVSVFNSGAWKEGIPVGAAFCLIWAALDLRRILRQKPFACG